MSQQSKRPGARRQADDVDEMGYADLVKAAQHHGVSGAGKMDAASLRGQVRAARAQQASDPGFDEGVTPVIDEATGDYVFPPKPTEPEPTASPTGAHPQRFVVTKTARYCRDGSVFTLAAGSVVSVMTHDMVGIRAQGIQLMPVDAVEVVRNEMGETRTLVDGILNTEFAEPIDHSKEERPGWANRK